MEKIIINLLPKEFTLAQVEQSKFKKIQIIGWSIIALLLLVSAATFGYRVLQLQELVKTDSQLEVAVSDVKKLQKKEVAINILKSRVDSISGLTNTPSKQRAAFDLLGRLVPPQVTINILTIDRNGNVTVALTLPNSDTVDSLMSNLVSKEKNEGKVSQVTVDGLSRIVDGGYRTNLTIQTK